MSDDLVVQARRWIDDDVDDAAAAELRGLVDAADHGDPDAHRELAERFAAPLAFGTAGLRGPLRAGPNGMNRTVVRRAAAGLAAWLTARGHAGRRVVVGFDARYGSHVFAQDSAAVLAAAGFEAHLMPAVLPTPVLAYAVQRLAAVAGVMVTASHNPPRDNGYKVYLEDGAQLVPPADREIEAAIRAVGATRDIALSPDAVHPLDDTIVTAYVDAVVTLVPDGPRDLRIVHTAMHGVGSEVVADVLQALGFTDVRPVHEQQQPDPDFPTVAFPNPEEPGALDLALALAHGSQAQLVIANDPDADRCAVAVPADRTESTDRTDSTDSTDSAGGWRMLRGDEVGVLLADSLLRRGVRGTYATTIVSSSMLGALARAHGVGYVETLTGFKWIARAAPDLVYGYEEALGYAVAPDLVRDKDGISAAALIADLAARLNAEGSSLLGRLDELAAEHGRYVTDQVSVRVDDLTIIDDTMRRVRAEPPTTLLGLPVTVEDLRPDADVLRWRVTDARVVVRPSGTEPKLKAYLEVVEPSGSADAATERLQQLRDEVASLLG